MSPKIFVCMARGPNLSALRTPFQFFTGWGSFQRSSPTGGAAKGIHLKDRMPEPESNAPSRIPFATLTCVSSEHFAGFAKAARVQITKRQLRPTEVIPVPSIARLFGQSIVFLAARNGELAIFVAHIDQTTFPYTKPLRQPGLDNDA